MHVQEKGGTRTQRAQGGNTRLTVSRRKSLIVFSLIFSVTRMKDKTVIHRGQIPPNPAPVSSLFVACRPRDGATIGPRARDLRWVPSRA
jgi:hypothetical protein